MPTTYTWPLHHAYHIYLSPTPHTLSPPILTNYTYSPYAYHLHLSPTPKHALLSLSSTLTTPAYLYLLPSSLTPKLPSYTHNTYPPSTITYTKHIHPLHKTPPYTPYNEPSLTARLAHVNTSSTI